MKQISLAESGWAQRPKQTRRQQFLAEMERVVPWERLLPVVAPAQPPASARGGRPAHAAGTMLRIHFMQQWFGLSDPAMEEALHDIPVMRAFAGLDSGTDALPDESSILRFRHRLEESGMAQRLFEEVNALLRERGLMLRQGTLVDATLIAAPSSTKNRQRARDPEMHQTRKGQQWHFGMKAHVGADAASGLVHAVVCTAAHVSDVTQAPHLLHGGETAVFADAGYQGVDKRPENAGRGIRWLVAMRPGKRRQLRGSRWGSLLERVEHLKARVRAKVEHPFRVIKRQFGYVKTRYRGLKKNAAQVTTLFALANLYQARHELMCSTG